MGRELPETNAEYWGAKIERNVARDRENEKGWKRQGWDVLVLWECQAKEGRQAESSRLIICSSSQTYPRWKNGIFIFPLVTSERRAAMRGVEGVIR
jgi:hypothetical protein